jgi:hypothetical protein
MTEKRLDRLLALACAGCVSLGLLALPPFAAAKVKRKAATFNQCVSAAVGIPDGPSAGSTAANPAAYISVPVTVPRFRGRAQSGVVTAFGSAGVRISHTDDGDLALFLVSPGGRVAALATYRDQSTNRDPDTGDPSPSGDGYGSGPGSCSGSLVEFGDAFGPSITTPGNTGLDRPITGSFRPEQPLAAFIGGPARGFWTLIVQDVQARDIGTINAVSLSFTYSYRAKKRKRGRR